jgi:hypothetical protein
MSKPLDLQAAETLVEVYRNERDEARAIVADLTRTLRKTLWHDLGCASMCSDDADCDCDARPTQSDAFVMEPLLVAERAVERWTLSYGATMRASVQHSSASEEG